MRVPRVNTTMAKRSAHRSDGEATMAQATTPAPPKEDNTRKRKRRKRNKRAKKNDEAKINDEA
ncbi:unnamed protein product [Clonostachys byssicola]|uniref:Uncharacterized protein n=1 Tax=Clonostachys byssicola TaxID=160290 RepID=A0A9N9UA64_9HYPO|nr:unnamed protein product [Clonostachys byssicola]